MKQDLTNQELHMLGSEMDKRKKSTGATWLIWFFFGGLGGHRYYLGRIGSGIAMTLTLGGFGIWALIDAFFINGMLAKRNEKIELEIIQEITLMRKSKAHQEVAATRA
jgi:TM2 domain-containing membrane protein YozV